MDSFQSLRQLRRLLATLGLRRRRFDHENVVRGHIQEEINGSGSGLGYRAMKLRLEHKHDTRASRETVRRILRDVDPEGVELRKKHCLRRRLYVNKGPNYMVHIDGYDKLKQYGFAIHGAIDGFSRKILWLRVAPTNNDPKVVAFYFLDYIGSIGGVPRIVRIDAGTENSTISKIQKAFRWDDNDNWSRHKSVIIGSSKNNQRIERWWAILRRQMVQYWMNLFKDMENLGVLSRANGLQKNILRFCLNDLLQEELNVVRNEWNMHNIRPSRNLETVSGKPNNLYAMPMLKGAEDYKVAVDAMEIQTIRNEHAFFPFLHGCTLEVSQVLTAYCREMNHPRPSTREEALLLYGVMLDNIQEIGCRIGRDF